MATARTLAILIGSGRLLVQPASANDQSILDQTVALYQEACAAAESAQLRTLFHEDFEGEAPSEFVQWYGGTVAWALKERGLNDVHTLSGRRSFAVSVEARDGGAAYFWIPVRLPMWSELTITMHVKPVDSEPRNHILGAGWAHPIGGHGGNTLPGALIERLEDGWEKWRCRALPTGDGGDYIQGLAIMVNLPKTGRVTYYIDDITVDGKLPDDYVDLHERIKGLIDGYFQTTNRAMYARRIENLGEWFNSIVDRFSGVKRPADSSGFANAQAAKAYAYVDRELADLTTRIARQLQMYREYEALHEWKINSMERALGPLGVYAESLAAFESYAGRFGDDPFVIYAVDPTQSYAILPAGPFAHQEEHSYYTWGGMGSGVPNPQVLAGEEPIPGVPSRELTGFGCRGQFVPLSFAIQSKHGLADLRFETTELVSEAGTIPASEVDLRVVKAWWRPHGKSPAYLNELLLHDDEFVIASPDEPVNRFKDTKFPNDLDTLSPVSMAPGGVRQFWATIRIPDDAGAGMYQGTIQASDAKGGVFGLSMSLEVMPFDLAPTPYAYGFYYRSYLVDEKTKKEQGVHSWYKTPEQMRKELINMAEHGCNTLNTYDGRVDKIDGRWDFSKLRLVLEMATEAGLTRSPFMWLAHGVPYTYAPDQERGPKTKEEMVERINEQVSAVSAFLESEGFPKASYYGSDERYGEELIQLRDGYLAITNAGGIVAQACYGGYFNEVGEALSLPIVHNLRHDPLTFRSMRASQAAGHEVWIYNVPATNMVDSPATYRRRYGLALWRNGEDGAVPWEYSGHPKNQTPYQELPTQTLYTMTHPTWDGEPIDTIHFEAWREGIYDTRYLVTLQNELEAAEQENLASELTDEIKAWLDTVSVHDDLSRVRRQMADLIIAMWRTTGS
jgi:hypothetical protein